MKKFRYLNKPIVMSNPDELIRFLDVDGNLIDPKTKIELTKDQVLEGYKFMVLSRQQDNYMLQLQRQGRMLTFAPNIGEEALQIACSLAMEKQDWFVPAFRSNAAMLHLGVPIVNQMLYWNGQENGSIMPEGVNVLPVNIPIATQCSHAAGLAYAAKELGTKAVSLSFIGNGGTTEGEFFEALNMAAVQKWPSVFCVNNNQWAISTPNHFESVASTIAAKAHAVGISGLRVDGNDLLASYSVIKDAVEFARENNQPVLVEFVTWRQGSHTTSDNPRIYRSEEMEKEHEKWEPMHRIEKYMLDKKYISKKEIEKTWSDALEQAKASYQESLTKVETKLEDIFDYTYEKLDDDLLEQKTDAIAYWTSVKGAK